jgi:hypothetical protein
VKHADGIHPSSRLNNDKLWFMLVTIFQTRRRVASGGDGVPICRRLMGGSSAGYGRGMVDHDALHNFGSWEGELATRYGDTVAEGSKVVIGAR